MDKKMDKKGYKAIDKFLDEMYQNGKSDTVCPFCNTKLKLLTHGNSYEVLCETKDCLKETYRGI